MAVAGERPPDEAAITRRRAFVGRSADAGSRRNRPRPARSAAAPVPRCRRGPWPRCVARHDLVQVDREAHDVGERRLDRAAPLVARRPGPSLEATAATATSAGSRSTEPSAAQNAAGSASKWNRRSERTSTGPRSPRGGPRAATLRDVDATFDGCLASFDEGDRPVPAGAGPGRPVRLHVRAGHRRRPAPLRRRAVRRDGAAWSASSARSPTATSPRTRRGGPGRSPRGRGRRRSTRRRRWRPVVAAAPAAGHERAHQPRPRAS